MRQKNLRWMLFWFLICLIESYNAEEPEKPKLHSHKNVNFNIFSPRMDYNQWKPIGRGDPLKNDPTYDYVPPVLDRVHYWVDPSLRKPDTTRTGDNQKTEILLLGVSSIKPATGSSTAESRRDTYDSYRKSGESNRDRAEMYNPNQRVGKPSFLPSIATNLFPSLFPFGNKNRYTDRTSYSKGTEQRMPYTVLMPPPMVTKNPADANELLPFTQSFSSTEKPLAFTPHFSLPTNEFHASSTPPAVTIQNSNLVYQSSSSSDGSEFKNNAIYSTLSSSNWQPTTKNPKPNLNEQVVYSPALTPPESFIRIEFSPKNATSNNLLEAADSNHKINFVTPPPLPNNDKFILRKGQVSNDDDVSNSYVKIGKPEAEVHTTGLDNLGSQPLVRQPPVVIFPHSKPFQKPYMTSLSTHKIENIPSMVSSSVKPQSTTPILNVMKSRTPFTQKNVFATTNTIGNMSPLKSSDIKAVNYLTSGSSVSNVFITKPFMTTSVTTTEPPVTTSTSLTTDPLFKHYKQPAEPLKGPLYLIIQGHSKVKTYRPTKQLNDIPENNEINDKDENDPQTFEVKHLHTYKKEPIDEGNRKGRSGDLQTLKHIAQTGFGAIDLSDDEVQRRSDDDFQEANLQVGYEVGDEQYVTSEKYHKGIVEEARKLQQ